MLVIGLTGGVASGKSTVSQLFTDLNIKVLDADIIARQLVQAKQPILQDIVEIFGNKILLTNGELDRSKLRNIIFADPSAKQQLESLLHPAIKNELREQIRETKDTDYIIVSVPLLIEAKFTDLVNRILVVDTSEQNQLKRLLMRDDISSDIAQKMLQNQLTNSERLQYADDIIDNNQDRSLLQKQVHKLHIKYQSLAKSC